MNDTMLLDNDVMLKTCCYAVVDDVVQCLREIAGHVLALGVAAFVLRNRIARATYIADKEAAAAALGRLLDAISLLEPADEEVALAADLEAEAQARSASLDSGESLLLAVLLLRCAALMLTGDKRAIHAIEVITHALGYAPRATGRIACLEQLVVALLGRCEPDSLHQRICREPAADTAVSLCFSCNSGAFSVENALQGLSSYISAVRSQAPTVLVPQDDLSTRAT